MQTPISNFALTPFDLTKYKGVHGLNFYEEDSLLPSIVDKYARSYTKNHTKDFKKHLHEYGELAGGILDDLVQG